ncbi:MAG TPA: peptide chain release factor N(5)-glutamine methyltransferase [Actinobacteria bacterium]|nr:peptide chain release factor N(5)-glutamine methyltransferase [Actinomycetota bacterium]
MFEGRVSNLSEALKLAASRFEEFGLESSLREAEILLGAVFGLPRSSLYAHDSRVLTEAEKASCEAIIEERLRGVPTQYILGEQPFRYLNLKLEPGVFIPRPETEILVELVVSFALKETKPLTVVDLGTGSGAIALSIAYEVPETLVYAVDISPSALEVARVNARSHGLEEKVVLIRGDLFDGLADLKGEVDIVVSNPPYVRCEEMKSLSKEIRDFEPLLALDGGVDGLKFHRRIVSESPLYLRAGGLLALEVGYDQAGAVAALIEEVGCFNGIQISRDYAGIKRFVTALRR